MPRESALVRAEIGPAADWGPQEHLLAAVFDTLSLANWQRGSGKKSRKPKPLPRPGENVKVAEKKTSMSIDEMLAFQAKWRAGESPDGIERKPGRTKTKR